MCFLKEADLYLFITVFILRVIFLNMRLFLYHSILSSKLTTLFQTVTFRRE